MNYQSKPVSALAYERFPGKTDIQISKPFCSPNGEEVRIVQTTGNSLIITPVGTSDSVLDTVVIHLPPDVAPETIEKERWLGGIWDGIKSVAKKGVELLAGGTQGGGKSGGEGDAHVTTQTDGDGNVIINTVQIHINCPPPGPKPQ